MGLLSFFCHLKQKQARGQALLQDFEEGSIQWQILELLEERVKPFVQQDGGDIEFVRAMAAMVF